MPDETNNSGRDAQAPTDGGREATPGAQPNSKYKPESLDEAMKIIDALTKRVGEREERIDNLGQRLAAIETAQRQRLEQSGNWQELATQRAAEVESLKPIAERAQALEAVIRESNTARIERIPEGMRTLIPTDYAPERLQAWLNANEARLTNPPPPQYDAGKGSGGSGKSVLTPEQEAMAKRFGLTVEEFAKQVQRKQGG